MIEEKNEIVELKLMELDIPVEYQRQLSPSRVRTIASNFRKYAAGYPLVNVRENGKCVVIDGHHRISAMRRNGIATCMCEVAYGLSLEQEAQLFDDRNSGVKRTSSLQRIPAKRIYGDTTTAGIDRVLAMIGLSFPEVGSSSRNPKHIVAIAALIRLSNGP
jgi:hypothetical protein